MALIKSDYDIEKLKVAGLLLSKALGAIVKSAVVGSVVSDLDKIAEKVILDGGGKPSFLNYTAGGDTPFPSTVCISVNDEVIHGLGNRELVLKEGDVVGFDMGLWLDGVAVDMAMTVGIGEISGELRQLLNVTKASLKKGIAAVKAGVPLQNISQAIENTILPHGYGIVKSYGGHGVGHEVHEEPFIPNFVSKEFPNPALRTGMVLAIEPMVCLGDGELYVGDDNWAAKTVDGSYTAHFENTIVVTETGAEIITPFPEV